MTISDATSGATIYYTTNGTTPTTSSTQYTGPITVSTTETLEAIAVATGDTNSAVASATYTITPTVLTPAFSPVAGTYTSAQSVSISDATSGATIYYTTNGTTPTTSSTRYTGPITVSSTETLEAIAAATGDPSAVASATYTITPTVSTPAFSPAAGTYTSAQSVSISDATSGATIYYTTNGTYAYHVLDQVHRPDYGELDGDAGGYRGSHGGHQQRGRICCLHNILASDSFNADLLPCRRDLYLCAVGDHLRCHLGRNHLLHDQRNVRRPRPRPGTPARLR